jgi:predicted metal-dependent hydrolase
MNLQTEERAAGAVNFTLRRSKRKTLAIHVHPDGLVEVVAPENATDEAIAARVSARAGWIRRQQVFLMTCDLVRLPADTFREKPIYILADDIG